MASSIFGSAPMGNNINQLMQLIKGNPQALFNTMMQSNPQFRSFYEANKNKPLEQLANESGIDINELIKLVK